MALALSEFASSYVELQTIIQYLVSTNTIPKGLDNIQFNLSYEGFTNALYMVSAHYHGAPRRSLVLTVKENFDERGAGTRSVTVSTVRLPYAHGTVIEKGVPPGITVLKPTVGAFKTTVMFTANLPVKPSQRRHLITQLYEFLLLIQTYNIESIQEGERPEGYWRMRDYFTHRKPNPVAQFFEQGLSVSIDSFSVNAITRGAPKSIKSTEWED